MPNRQTNHHLLSARFAASGLPESTVLGDDAVVDEPMVEPADSELPPLADADGVPLPMPES